MLKAPPRRSRWRPSLLTWLAALCGAAGIMLLTYTPAASWLAQYQQSQLIDSYNDSLRRQATTGTPPSPQEALEAARKYNMNLASGALVAANTNIPQSTGDPVTNDYHTLLMGPGDVMARLRIPSIDVDLPIYHGTADETLLRGAGHLQGTSLPVGGESTHAVVTAHRGLAEATMFSNLDQVGVGDSFTIEVFGDVLTYRVIQTQVVAPEEQEALYPRQGQDLVTLVTCTPLGINTHRILVTAERVIPTPEGDREAALLDSELPRFPWWAIWAGTGLVVIIVFVWRSGYRDARLRELSVVGDNLKE